MGSEASISSESQSAPVSNPRTQKPPIVPASLPNNTGAKSAPLPLTPEELAARRTRIWIMVAAVAMLLLLVAFIVFMAAKPTAAVVIRDIAIVLVAVETFIIGLVFIVLVFQLQVLTQVLRDEIQPLLRSVNDTVSTVRGTTQFMSHNLVNPIMKWSSLMAGVRQVINDITGVARASRPKHASTKSSMQEDSQ